MSLLSSHAQCTTQVRRAAREHPLVDSPQMTADIRDSLVFCANARCTAASHLVSLSSLSRGTVKRCYSTSSQVVLVGADGDYGEQGSPFVRLLKQYMARAPAQLAEAALDGACMAAAGDAIACEARRAGAQLLRAAAAAAGSAEQAALQAAAEQAVLKDAADNARRRSEEADAVRAALAESRQVRCTSLRLRRSLACCATTMNAVCPRRVLLKGLVGCSTQEGTDHADDVPNEDQCPDLTVKRRAGAAAAVGRHECGRKGADSLAASTPDGAIRSNTWHTL